MSNSGKFQTAKLGSVCLKIGSGATPRGGKEVYLADGEFSLIRSQNVYNNQFYPDGIAYISQKQADELSNVEVQANDVLLNITGDSVARCCQVPKYVLPARVNQHVAIIRPNKDELDPRFLGYFLVSPQMQEHMLTLASAGATRNALTKSMIENFDVPRPEIFKQRSIAQILGTLDDKIQLNKQMNEVLEEMAQAIFKSWFVNFDPVHAKAEGKKPFGMDKETAVLFPDSFEDSDLGEIPKGWRIGNLEEIISIESGKRPNEKSESQTSEFAVQLIGASGLMGYVKDKLYIEPIIVIGRVGTHGVVQRILGHSFPSDNTLVIRTSFYEYVYQVMKKINYQSLNVGSTQPLITQSSIKVCKILIPDKMALLKFEELASGLFKKIQSNNEENKILSQLRDMLLPKLMLGEIRVNLKKLEGVIS